MAERADLEAAADAGVIAREQVDPLAAFLSARRAPAASPGGEEDLRFIRNFHDVFLAIGIVLFAVGMAVAIGTNAAAAPDWKMGAVRAGALSFGAGAVMWGLGELFARRRRLFLPAIATVISLTLFVAFAVAALYFALVVGRELDSPANDLRTAPPVVRNGILLATAMFVLAPMAFYLRFRLPFSMGLIGAGAAGFLLVTGFVIDWETTLRWLPALYLLFGFMLFLAGVAFDARDPGRQTRFSDNGFWLHFAAAPLLLNGAFGLLGQVFGVPRGAEGAPPSAALAIASEGGGAAAQAAATLAVVLLLGLVSLLINRRALIVSALLTTGVAIGVLMNAVGLDAGSLAASTLIVLGGFVLILGAGWHSVRRALLARVKPDGVWARIFPPEAPAAA